MVKTVFEKRNGDIIERIRKTIPFYRIGEETSMGWIVKDIKYKYKNNWYSQMEYDTLVTKAYTKEKKIANLKRKIKFIYSNAAYFLLLLIIARTLESIASLTII